MAVTSKIATECCSPLTDQPLSESEASALALLFKALADPIRLRLVSIVAAADAGEICACDLPELLQRSQPTISHHLSQLTEASILVRENGKWAWYRVNAATLNDLCTILNLKTDFRCANPRKARLQRRLLWARLIGLLLVVIGLSAAMVIWGAETILTTIESRATGGWTGVAIFIALYALATAALVPGSAATATAGALYGSVAGGAVAVTGATLGAIAGYSISRTVAREPAKILLAPRVHQVESFLADHQFRTVLLLRLLPIVPFSGFNYAAGLTPIRLGPFTAGTFLGILPATFLLALVGDSLRDPTSPVFIISLGLFVTLVIGSSAAAKRFISRD